MLTGLHHVGYVVPDLDTAIAFYTDTLGLRLDRRGDAGPGMGFEVAVFRLGDGTTGIELIRPTTEVGPFAEFLRANPAGALHHIAYTTDGPLDGGGGGGARLRAGAGRADQGWPDRHGRRVADPERRRGEDAGAADPAGRAVGARAAPARCRA